MTHQKALILDFGGPAARKAAIAVRECGVWCEVHQFSVGADLPDGRFGGIIAAGKNARRYFGEEQASRLAPGFPVLYIADGEAIDLSNLNSKKGRDCLSAFLFTTCGFAGDWSYSAFVEETVRHIREKAGSRRASMVLTSSAACLVTAKLMSMALGEDFVGIFGDTGMLRRDEGEYILNICRGFDMTLVNFNNEARYLYRLVRLGDPQKKREAFTSEYAYVLFAMGRKTNSSFVCALPDTCARTQLFEPELPSFETIIHPVASLYEEEMPVLAEYLGVELGEFTFNSAAPYGMLNRCMGCVTRDRLAVLRDADAIWREELSAAGVKGVVAFAALSEMKTAGVRAGSKVYEETVVLRAVDPETGKTASVSQKTLSDACHRITRETTGVSRVLFDVTDIPPALIEFE